MLTRLVFPKFASLKKHTSNYEGKRKTLLLVSVFVAAIGSRLTVFGFLSIGIWKLLRRRISTATVTIVILPALMLLLAYTVS